MRGRADHCAAFRGQVPGQGTRRQRRDHLRVRRNREGPGGMRHRGALAAWVLRISQVCGLAGGYLGQPGPSIEMPGR